MRKKSTEQVFVKVMEDGSAVDQHGKVRTHEIPRYARTKALKRGQCLKLVHGKKATQWRLADMDEYDALARQAIPLKPVANEVNELQADVSEFLQHCDRLLPDTLIMSALKWKYLMRSVLRGKNIMITGPSGCGKTLAVQTVSAVLSDRPFFYFNLGATQDARSTLIGNTHFDKSRGTFVAEALFVKAIQTPNSIILLDEVSRAHPDAHNILMTVLDQNQRYLRIDEHPETPTVKVAKGVTFIGTANIGAEYTATRVLDRALTDRFVIVEMDTLALEEETLLLRRIYPAVNDSQIQAIAEIADHTRKQNKSDDPKVSTIISTRMTVEMAGLLYDGFTLAEAAEACIYPFYSDAGGVDSERTYMKQLVQKYLGEDGTDKKPWEKIEEVEENF
jgi:nitric oxide reductase NorQ protein